LERFKEQQSDNLHAEDENVALGNRNSLDAPESCQEPENKRLLLLAGELYNALKTNDSVCAQKVMATDEFGVPLLAMLVRWTEMTIGERAEQKDNDIRSLSAQIDAIAERNKARTKKASETKRENSRIPDIMHWFYVQEKRSRHLMEKDIVKSAAKHFSVTESYIRIMRVKYLAKKSATNVR